ncbi:hypothetical protein GCM10010329_58540 [Streptomyces spiroverticillatus]|uniref:Guanylate cyclase domain-containing protein n=1 Tax=Streptomyces finlayi TaxID=67296 RepID=A0A918X3I0_9ACTN|nr:hypothetical protein [Streptomyces finlayi]GHA27567.1 hypothetical protein GCM10010329_58540 [Streptomyces spiroverticillatus]GHD08667.1 hypothetical protein GCM10010334_62200 [Streptomyces finlayi]
MTAADSEDTAFPDVLAAVDLLAVDGAVPKGGEAPADRLGGASLGRPLAYSLSHTATDAHHDVLLCFPFDLEEPAEALGYQEATLTVRFEDEAYARSLYPAAATTTADGAEISAFGLGQNRLRWTFRAPGRGGILRPDGRWAQTVVRLPATSDAVSGQLDLSVVTVQPVLGGLLRRREAQAVTGTRFWIPAEDAWRSTTGITEDGMLPGTWALARHEDDEADETAGEPAREELPPGLRRLCLAVDIEKYSARDTADMIRLQRVLLHTLRTACRRAGVDWHRCGRQAQGDGYLLVLEPGIDESRVVPALLAGLAGALAEANAHAATEDVRMRAGLHQGIVHEADSGYAGNAVILLFRVLDSDAVRRTLAETGSTHLVAAFSDALYHDLVAHGYAGLSAQGFQRVEIEIKAKNFTGVAWIRAVRPPRNHQEAHG